MGFLNPLLLAGSLVLAMPILLHLVRNDRSERVRFSSLMFLLRIPKKTVRQQRLRNLLLMALRLLLIALLVAAFARPYFEESTAAVLPGPQDESLVLMLDNSYSMTYGTNFERMQSEATSRLNGLSPGTRAGLVVFNANATAPVQVTDDLEELRAVVSGVEPSSSRTNYYEAFAVADRVLAQLEGTRRKLVVISDFQRNGWNRPSRESLVDADVEVEFVNLAVENPQNTGIDTVGLDATVFSRLYSGQLRARVRNHRLVDAAPVTVALEISGRRVDAREVSVPAASSTLVEFTGFELPDGYAEGRVVIEDADSLMTDNEWAFVIHRRERMDLLIVDAGVAGQSRFLQVNFASAPEFPFTVERIAYNAVTPARIARARVVIVNDVPRLSDPIRDALNEARAAGQGQLVVLAANAEAAAWNAFEELPVRLGEKIFVQRDRNRPFYSLTKWDRGHEVFAALESGSGRFSLNTVQFSAYTGMEPDPGAIVIASLEEGSPMMVQTPADQGRLLVFGSAVDGSAWNDLRLKPSFVPLMHETARFLAGYRDSAPYYELGATVPVPAGEPDQATAVVTPRDERLTLGEGGAAGRRFFTPDQAGFYELRLGPEIVPVAVNVPSEESILESMPPEDLLASVRRGQGEFRSGALLGEAGETNYAERQNLWWYLFLFALLVGIGEIYLGNRVTDVRERRPATNP
jgi:hypothetical protein